MSLAASSAISSIHAEAGKDFKRAFVKYNPSIWGNTFFQFDSDPLEVYDNTKQQDQMYKEKIRIYLSSSNNILEKLSIIDSIQQLGISYQFEDEICEALEQTYNDLANNKLTIKDLHGYSLLFRLLREGRYHVSSDMFNKFKNNKGNFNEVIGQNIQEIWSLYEAAQLSTYEEDILEEALDFTYSNLKSMMMNNHGLSPTLAAYINQCLRKPLHKSIPRIKARSYMSLYQEDPSHNKDLLAFARVDFNTLQKMHQNEVGINTKWWIELEIGKKVPYTRDCVVEAYFWSLLVIPEPKYSFQRTILGKLIICIALLDDTYDNYATIQELELFTEAIYRWDIGVIESLPECMKVVFSVVAKLCGEIELETAKNGKSSLVVQYIKQAFFNFVQSYLVEAKWCHESYVPTYDEYKINGIETSTMPLEMTVLIALGEFATKDLFDWIFNNPKVLKAVSLIARLMDDLGTHKFEQQSREHVASGVECCMKQYDVSQEDAYKLIKNEIKGYWKDINEACLINSDDIPKHVLDLILGLARATEFTYSNLKDDVVESFEDKFSNGQLTKDYVVALLLDAIVS